MLAVTLGCSVDPVDPAVAESAANASEVAPSRFAYEDLVGLIRGQNVRSVAELLPLLPEELRSNYALMRQSRSLQFASPRHPRVILFGRDARLTCAFSGDPKEPSFDTLECVQFRERERTFDFREVQFPTAANGLAEVRFSDTNVSADGRTSCTTCHGADPRPNWNGYSRWPGAYGSDDDTMSEHDRDYAAFVAGRAADPRYRWLIQGPKATDPYVAGVADLAHRPNLRFSDAVNRMNALRAARIMLARVPPGRSLGFAVASLGCALSAEQRASLTSAGVDPRAALDRDAIFSEVRYPSALWGTNVLGDPGNEAPYDHQSGYSYLAIDIGMVLVQDLARAGDLRLQSGLAQIVAYTGSAYAGSQLAYFAALNELVPDPQYFGGHFRENLAEICPALGDAFVEAATAHAIEARR